MVGFNLATMSLRRRAKSVPATSATSAAAMMTMRMATALPVVLALTLLVAFFPTAARAQQQLVFLNGNYETPRGKPIPLKWTGNRGPVNITLMNGLDENLQRVLVVVTGYAGPPPDSFVFNPPSDLPTDFYEIQIEDGVSNPDYTPRFQYPVPADDIRPPSSSTASQQTSSSTSASTPTGPSTASPEDSASTLVVTGTRPSQSVEPTSTLRSDGNAAQPSSSEASSTGGLSAAARGGIGAGAAVAGVVLLGLLGCMLYRQGQRAAERRLAAPVVHEPPPGRSSKWPRMHVTPRGDKAQPTDFVELPHEMDHKELWGSPGKDSARGRAELAATSAGADYSAVSPMTETGNGWVGPVEMPTSEPQYRRSQHKD
ncbi:hypothetical protein B0T24DRAFT_413778 [Lasiosphaeria ovina]|uniref:Yeast cell wall synthesis Kre9/Knh1-like N-terminal domain-containing protein n=1 Tax=Lasiosphaeria ovina TaxID=92902 RepID=A0AAE0JXH3_9PEZI|nr:hypothetical protein B0T24DRAFT_413778 [Lasiosphaeria ovina]